MIQKNTYPYKLFFNSYWFICLFMVIGVPAIAYGIVSFSMFLEGKTLSGKSKVLILGIIAFVTILNFMLHLFIIIHQLRNKQALVFNQENCIIPRGGLSRKSFTISYNDIESIEIEHQGSSKEELIVTLADGDIRILKSMLKDVNSFDKIVNGFRNRIR